MTLAILASPLIASSSAFAQADPLSSWTDSAPKKAIVEFVAHTTTTGSPDFVQVLQRMAIMRKALLLAALAPAGAPFQSSKGAAAYQPYPAFIPTGEQHPAAALLQRGYQR